MKSEQRCVVCGLAFFAKPSQKRLYCSRACYTGARQPSGDTKLCRKCGETKPKDAFYRNRSTADGLQARCKPCVDADNRIRSGKYSEWQQRYARLWHVKRFYGLTEEQYRALWERTQGACYICGRSEATPGRGGRVRAIAVDHDATTGRVRGLLCHACNVGIGNANHDPALLRKWIAYLEG